LDLVRAVGSHDSLSGNRDGRAEGRPGMAGLPPKRQGPNLELEQCTHAGRPFGDAEFVAEIADRFDRKWIRGRPKRRPDPVSMPSDAQGGLFTD